MTSKVTLVTDPLLDDFGPGRVARLVGRYLARHRKVTMVAPSISDPMTKRLESHGIHPVDLGLRPISKASSVAFMETWLREALLCTQSARWSACRREDGPVINLSNTVPVAATAWYLLGSVSDALADMAAGLPPPLRMGVLLGTPIVRRFDRRQISEFSRLSQRHVASSETCGQSYRKWDVHVDDVIYPPLDTELFRPSSASPPEDFCVAYLGKETDFNPLIALADAGVRIVAFGSKWRSAPVRLATHPNVRCTGSITDDELSRLYSQAKLTLFPFTAEPFGYIPVESMACGTPVLTYDRQGPSETVLEGKTGWKVQSGDEFVDRGLRVWEDGAIPRETRDACRERGLAFSCETTGEQWLRLLETAPTVMVGG